MKDNSIIPDCTVTRLLKASENKNLPCLNDKGVCNGALRDKEYYTICTRCKLFKR